MIYKGTESGVYQIICTANNKFYVGSTDNFHRRCREHLNDLKKNKHFNKRLQYIFNKYPNDFTFNVLEYTDDLLAIEQSYLDTVFALCKQECVNSCPIAGTTKGRIVRESTRKIMAKIRTGTKHSEDTKKKMSLAKIGIKFKPAHKAAMVKPRRNNIKPV